MTEQTFEIDGLKELLSALQELPDYLQDKIIKAFLVKAGRKFVVDDLKTSLPYSQTIEGHGKLEGRQRFRVVTDPNNKNAVFAGVSMDSFWLRFVDLGTKERGTLNVKNSKKMHFRGSITARNQVEKVIDSEIQPIIDYARNEFGNEIEKNLQRRIKRINKINNA